jgi:hypothetical protein
LAESITNLSWFAGCLPVIVIIEVLADKNKGIGGVDIRKAGCKECEDLSKKLAPRRYTRRLEFNADDWTRTSTGCPTCPSNMRVYQFHHIRLLYLD